VCVLDSRYLWHVPLINSVFLVADSIVLPDAFQKCPVSTIEPPSQHYCTATYPTTPANAAEDPRAFVGIARINWLHSHYKITNAEYLYTLSLFMLDPIRWTDKYGWRKLSPLERRARFVFFKRIGQLMSIDDIPDTLEELEVWADVRIRATDQCAHADPRQGLRG